MLMQVLREVEPPVDAPCSEALQVRLDQEGGH